MGGREVTCGRGRAGCAEVKLALLCAPNPQHWHPLRPPPAHQLSAVTMLVMRSGRRPSYSTSCAAASRSAASQNALYASRKLRAVARCVKGSTPASCRGARRGAQQGVQVSHAPLLDHLLSATKPPPRLPCSACRRCRCRRHAAAFGMRAPGARHSQHARRAPHLCDTQRQLLHDAVLLATGHILSRHLVLAAGRLPCSRAARGGASLGPPQRAYRGKGAVCVLLAA